MVEVWLLLPWSICSGVLELQQLWPEGSRAQAQQLWPTGLAASCEWDLPIPGIKTMSSTLADRSSTTGPPGKSLESI